MPPTRYTAALLEHFAAGEHARYLAGGGLRPRLARALALACLRPGLQVVDIGCGRGEAAVHAARRGANVVALDFSPGAVELSRQTADTLLGTSPARRRLQLVAADGLSLPLAAGTADRVLLLDVVEHLLPRQLDQLWREVGRILRPGGYVVIHTLPNRWALAVAYPLLRPLVPDLPADARSPYERAVHVNEFDPWTLRRALGTAGFKARVWVEEWTTRQAAWTGTDSFPDAARARGYPFLRRAVIRRLARVAMASPLGWVVGNDVFALAWPPGGPGPPPLARLRPVR